jgi:hypothetical protein
MARMGHFSSAAALCYQHVMAGRDVAIAAALDELIEAASALAEIPPSAPSGTRVTRIGQSGSGKKRRPVACFDVVVEHSMSYPNPTELHDRISTLSTATGRP